MLPDGTRRGLGSRGSRGPAFSYAITLRQRDSEDDSGTESTRAGDAGRMASSVQKGNRT